MDLLDRLLEHDAWTTRELLRRSRELTEAQLDQEFDIGHRSVRKTLIHILRNLEIWSDLLLDHPVRPDSGRSIDALLERLERAAADFARVARAVRERAGWDERWLDRMDRPPTEKTYGGSIAHVITHSMHHRAQLLYMLRRLGAENLPEGDVLSWEQQSGAT